MGLNNQQQHALHFVVSVVSFGSASGKSHVFIPISSVICSGILGMCLQLVSAVTSGEWRVLREPSRFPHISGVCKSNVFLLALSTKLYQWASRYGHNATDVFYLIYAKACIKSILKFKYWKRNTVVPAKSSRILGCQNDVIWKRFCRLSLKCHCGCSSQGPL